MALTGRTFDLAVNTSASDAVMYNYLTGGAQGFINGYGSNMAITISGTNLVIGTGMFVTNGRFIEVTSAITYTPSSTGNNRRLILDINLANTNTATGTPGTSGYTVTNNQVSLIDDDGTPTLIQQDLTNGGTRRQVILATFNASTSAVSNLSIIMGQAINNGMGTNYLSVLRASSATVNVGGIIVNILGTSLTTIANSGITISATGVITTTSTMSNALIAGQLTFTVTATNWNNQTLQIGLYNSTASGSNATPIAWLWQGNANSIANGSGTVNIPLRSVIQNLPAGSYIIAANSPTRTASAALSTFGAYVELREL